MNNLSHTQGLLKQAPYIQMARPKNKAGETDFQETLEGLQLLALAQTQAQPQWEASQAEEDSATVRTEFLAEAETTVQISQQAVHQQTDIQPEQQPQSKSSVVEARQPFAATEESEEQGVTTPGEANDEVIVNRVDPETQASKVRLQYQTMNPLAAQERFNNMLTKASLELGRAEKLQQEPLVHMADISAPDADAEEPVQPEKAVEFLETEQLYDVDEPEEVERTDKAETDKAPNAPVKDAEIPEQKTTTKMSAIRTDAAPITEQKPLKEMPETDRAALEMVGQKEPEYLYFRDPVAQPADENMPQARVPEQAEQIRTQIIENLETQKMEFQMQLHPQELGKVDVRMILEGGKLVVQITAANAHSAEILTRQTDSLIASLRTGSLTVESVTVVTLRENAGSHVDAPHNLDNFQANAHRRRDGGNTGNRKGNDSNGQQDEEEKSSSLPEPQRILNYTV